MKVFINDIEYPQIVLLLRGGHTQIYLMKNENDIELTFSINAGKRYRFKRFSTDIDPVFNTSIFEGLKPVEFDGDSLLLKKLYFFSNLIILFFKSSNSLSDKIGELSS